MSPSPLELLALIVVVQVCIIVACGKKSLVKLNHPTTILSELIIPEYSVPGGCQILFCISGFSKELLKFKII